MVTCEVCGVGFQPRRKTSGRFCSRSCSKKGPRSLRGAEFFQTWSSDMAYVVGFIAADGSMDLRGSWGSVIISSTDRDVIERMASRIGDVKVHVAVGSRRGRDYKDVYRIEIHSWGAIRKLIDIGICPRKSYNMGPLNIPDEFFWHFLRGFTDGDGCLTLCGGKKRVSWTGGCEKFMAWLHGEVCGRMGLRVRFYKRRTSENFEFCFGGASACEVVRNMRYGDGICLSRKRDIAELWGCVECRQ